MAFCPECGKSAAAEASRCIHCGHELAPTEKKVGGGRFKGTMMMAAPVVAKPAAPANVKTPATAVTPAQVATPAAAPAQAAPPLAAARPAAKSAAKATMIGAGIAVPIPKPAPAPAAIAAPVANHVDPQRQAALAETALFAPQAQAPVAQAAAVHVPLAPVAPVVRDTPNPDASAAGPAGDVRKYLPGDPMAPQPSAARQPALRLSEDDSDSVKLPTLQDRKWLLLAVGGVVLVSVLVLAIGLMH